MDTIQRPSFTDEEALAFHAAGPQGGKPGKLAIAPNPDAVYDYTAKGNFVAVISNGTAILGLGDLGPLAAKPVMEGKAVLFKRFANIDVFDIEVAAESPQAFIET